MAQAAQPRGAAHAGLINPPADSTVMKVLSSTAPVGPNQERYLANGKEVGMRLFELEAGRGDPPHARDYETVGYCVSGRARLFLEGKPEVHITAGQAYCVPTGVRHHWKVDESLEVVEACAPIPFVKGRDFSVKPGV